MSLLRLAGTALVALCAITPSTTAQQAPLPVIDMHLHALAADAQGPPPLGLCPGQIVPFWDQRRSWPETFASMTKAPPCSDPVWSPKTDEALRDATLAVLQRRNIVGVLSGAAETVEQWRALAPDRIIPALVLQAGAEGTSVARIEDLHRRGQLSVLGEVVNQYGGMTPDDPAFDPYLAAAEALDIPVGIHVGTGPPGAPYLGFSRYRARLHSALTLEEPLLRHPKLRLYAMHAGWPMVDDLLAMMWAHPQLHVEVGVIVWALPRAEFYRYLQRIVEAGFGQRVMFGSDQMQWPGMIEHGVRVIEEAPFLNGEQKRDVLYNNAARFLRLSPEEVDRHHGRTR